jgi:lipopolysaccharide heptosyltransferase III
MTPGKILVVMTRRIGDVLLTTPVIRSMRRAWPQAQIDVLVFEGTGGVLLGNPDINGILTVAQQSSTSTNLRLLARLWRHYDLALSMVPGDRPTLYSFVAGRHRVGLVAAGEKHAWKKWLLSQWVPFDNVGTHTVLMHLKLVELLGIEPCYEVVAAWRQEDEAQVRQVLPFDPALQGYAVLHVYPMYAYKMWHRDAWIDLAEWLRGEGLRVVLTGGKAPEEMAYIGELLKSLPADTLNAAGQLSLGGVACLLSRARAYVGPDTVVTHMAAALGVPTVALFGPSNPVKWGPWPCGYREGRNPYQMRGTQRVNNVVLLQGDGDCVPCMEEGCERRITSLSNCLQELPAARATSALRELWGGQKIDIQIMDDES